VFTGYGFGWEALRRWLEALGLASEHIYVAKKRGCFSPYEAFFSEPDTALDQSVTPVPS